MSNQLYDCVADGAWMSPCHRLWPRVHPPNCQIAFPNRVVSLFKDKDNQLSGVVDKDNSSVDKSNAFSSSVFTWILYCGASHHMTIANPLSQNVYYPSQYGQLPNWASLPVCKIVNLQITHSFDLKNVLYILNFHCSLISIRHH